MKAIDQNKLNEFVGKFASDFGASLHAPTIILGEKLGLYKAMAEEGKEVSARELAAKTGTKERYVGGMACSSGSIRLSDARFRHKQVLAFTGASFYTRSPILSQKTLLRG